MASLPFQSDDGVTSGLPLTHPLRLPSTLLQCCGDFNVFLGSIEEKPVMHATDIILLFERATPAMLQPPNDPGANPNFEH